MGLFDQTETIDKYINAILTGKISIESIPQRYLNEKLYLASLLAGGKFENIPGKFDNIPAQFRTETICSVAMHKEGSLYLVDEDLQTYDICRSAILQNGDNIDQVANGKWAEWSQENIFNLSVMAILQNGGSATQLKNIEQFFRKHLHIFEYITPDDLYMASAQKNGWAYLQFPKSWFTPTIRAIEKTKIEQAWLSAVRNNGKILTVLDNELRTESVCLAALRQDIQEKKHAFTDDPFEPIALLKFVPKELRTKEMCLTAIQQNIDNIDFVPEELLTEDFYRQAFARNALFFSKIPEKFLTEDLCMEAVKRDGTLLQFVLPRFQTKELYRTALEQNGKAIAYIPSDKLNDDLITISLFQDGNNLWNIPHEYRSTVVCHIAIEHTTNGDIICAIPNKLKQYSVYLSLMQHTDLPLSEVPHDFYTTEMFQYAVQHHGKRLQDIPPELLTSKLCELAVLSDGLALEFVPKKFRTENLYLEAIQQNGQALQFVPRKQQTQEMYKLAVQQDGRALCFIPPKLRTEELCQIAVEQNSDALFFVPPELRTEYMYLSALRKDEYMYLCAIRKDVNAFLKIPVEERTQRMYEEAIIYHSNADAIKYVPIDKLTHAMCQSVLKKDGLALRYIPLSMLKEYPELYMTAVSQNGLALQYILQSEQTDELCTVAVKQNGMALQYVSSEYYSNNIFLSAVSQDGLALQYIPREMLTEEICRVAVQQNGNALQYVPEYMQTKEICDIAVQQNEEAKMYILVDSEIEKEKNRQRQEKIKQEIQGIVSSIEKTENGNITKDKIQEVFHLHREELLSMIQEDPKNLSQVPEYLRLEELCVSALNQDPSVLRFVPASVFTSSFCLSRLDLYPEFHREYVTAFFNAMEQNDSPITPEIFLKSALVELLFFQAENKKQHLRVLEAIIPEKYLTEEFCRWFVNLDKNLLQYIPEKLRTQSVCETALKKDSKNIASLPIKSDSFTLSPQIKKILLSITVKETDLVNSSFLNDIFLKDNFFGCVLLDVFSQLKREKGRISANTFRGLNLNNIVIPNVSPQLSEQSQATELKAISLPSIEPEQQMIPEFKYYLDTHRDEVTEISDIIRLVGTDGLANVPKTKKSTSVQLFYANLDWKNLKYISYNSASWTVPFEARRLLASTVAQNGMSLQYCPAFVMRDNPDLVLQALQNNGKALQFLQKEDRTFEFCMVAIKENGMALEFVPRDKFSETEFKQLCETALSENFQAIRFIPDRYLDKDRLAYKKEILQGNGQTERPPLEILPDEQLLKIFAKDPMAFVNVPQDKITHKIIETATVAFLNHGQKLGISSSDFIETLAKRSMSLWQDTSNRQALIVQFAQILSEYPRTKAGLLNIRFLQDIPEEIRQDILSETVRTNPEFLGILPIELRTPDVCASAVSNDTQQFANIPVGVYKQTAMIATHTSTFTEAIDKNMDWFSFCQKELQTEDICIVALRKDKSAIDKIRYDLLTSNIVTEIALNYPLSLANIPKEKLTEKAIFCAVLKDPYLVKYLPLEDIPTELRSAKICAEYARISPDFLHSVPESVYEKTAMLVTRKPSLAEAVEQNIAWFLYCPKPLLNEDMIVSATKKDMSLLANLPDEVWTEDLALRLVKEKPESLELIPWFAQTEKVCQEAIQRDPTVISYVAEDLLTTDLCREAVGKDWKAIANVPMPFLTYGVCMTAIYENKNALFMIPPEVATHKLCRSIEEHMCRQGILDTIKVQEWLQQAQDMIYSSCSMENVHHLMEGNISLVPLMDRYRQACLDAVEKNADNMRSVPALERSMDFYIEAVARNEHATPYVYRPYQTTQFFQQAVERNPYVVMYMNPTQSGFSQIVQTALKKDPNVLFALHEEIRKFNPMLSATAVLSWIQQTGGVESWPDKLYDMRRPPGYEKTRSWAEEPMFTNLLEEEKATAYGVAIGAGLKIDFLPTEWKTTEKYTEMIQSFPSAVFGVPENELQDSMVETAVEKQWDIISEIPEKKRTFKACLLAYQQAKEEAIPYIPENIRRDVRIEATVIERNGGTQPWGIDKKDGTDKTTPSFGI